ncbi:MAG: hypothetical protein PHY94_07035, partial [Candidatus Omnitrophica bacterium]|nr:hypothetical protein [Candidatus Omnitrophota bacterium]
MMEISNMGQGVILETKKPKFRPWMRMLSLFIIFTFFFQITHVGYIFAQGDGGGDGGEEGGDGYG